MLLQELAIECGRRMLSTILIGRVHRLRVVHLGGLSLGTALGDFDAVL